MYISDIGRSYCPCAFMVGFYRDHSSRFSLKTKLVIGKNEAVTLAISVKISSGFAARTYVSRVLCSEQLSSLSILSVCIWTNHDLRLHEDILRNKLI